MALNIYFDFENEMSQMQTWHVGEKFYLKYPLNHVAAVHASDNELEFIRCYFSNLPITNFNFCKWTDELATFVASNLRLMK